MSPFEMMEEIEQIEGLLKDVEQMKVSTKSFRLYRYLTKRLEKLNEELTALAVAEMKRIDEELELHLTLEEEYEYLDLEEKREGWE